MTKRPGSSETIPEQTLDFDDQRRSCSCGAKFFRHLPLAFVQVGPIFCRPIGSKRILQYFDLYGPKSAGSGPLLQSASIVVHLAGRRHDNDYCGLLFQFELQFHAGAGFFTIGKNVITRIAEIANTGNAGNQLSAAEQKTIG
jgi:hypothetical protein